MDEHKPGPDLAHTQINYEVTPNPELKGAHVQAIEGDSAAPASASPTPVVSSDPPAQSVAAPQPIANPEPTQQQPSNIVPPDEKSEVDFSDAVMHAKQIMERTKDDPYTQALEISRLKAQVMKQQFNKDISVEEA